MQFFAASRLVIVAGKGGVGKTTVTAALAIAAAGLGLRVLVVEVEGKSGLGPMLGARPASSATRRSCCGRRARPAGSGEIRAARSPPTTP